MSEEQLIQYMIKRIEDIDNKVDKLLEFKWKLYGMALASGAAGAGSFELITKIMAP